MKCKQCGFKNGKDKNFCTNCGAALKKEKTELSKKQIITIAVSGAAVFAVICAAVFLPRKKGAKSADVTENPAVSESSFDEIRPEKTTEESEVREASSEVGAQNSSSEAGVQKPSSEAPKTDTVSDAPSSVPAALIRVVPLVVSVRRPPQWPQNTLPDSRDCPLVLRGMVRSALHSLARSAMSFCASPKFSGEMICKSGNTSDCVQPLRSTPVYMMLCRM